MLTPAKVRHAVLIIAIKALAVKRVDHKRNAIRAHKTPLNYHFWRQTARLLDLSLYFRWNQTLNQ